MATETAFKHDIAAMARTASITLSAPESIDDRVAATMAVSEYLRAMQAFEAASTRFNEACNRMRTTIPKNSRFVTKVDFSSHLVTTNNNGDFEVLPVPVI